MNIAQTFRDPNHSAEWHAERMKGIGGSDATILMEGKWRDLWAVKTGRAPDADLSGVLAVQMGVATEDFNRAWFTKQTGIAVSTADCEHLTHGTFTFARANLDGRTQDAVFEAKHVGDKFTIEEIAQRYHWQVQHCLLVSVLPRCHLSVFFGNSRWATATIERDEVAITELIEAEREFWRCVELDKEPHDRAVLTEAQAAVAALREVDLTGNNEWAMFAADWRENRKAAKKFDAAEKGLKGLVEADVKRAFGHGIEIKRASNMSMRIGEL